MKQLKDSEAGLMTQLWKSQVARPPWSVSLPYEKFNTRLVVRSVDDLSYPESDQRRDAPSISSWFRINIWDIDASGIEVYSRHRGFMDCDGRWFIPMSLEKLPQGMRELNVVWVGRIPSRNIVKFNPEGDQYQDDPHLLVRYSDRGEPYDRIRHGYTDGLTFLELSSEARSYR